jgi:hypothetical protein
MPLALVGIVAAYSVLKFLSMHCSSTLNHDVVKAHLVRFLVHKAVTILQYRASSGAKVSAWNPIKCPVCAKSNEVSGLREIQ